MMRRFNHMVLDDPQKQKYLQSLVDGILANWPFKLIGYNYSVKIIKSNWPKSFAICGIIYIDSSLTDSVNNEEELEAILVREIVHVERRHAIRKYVEAAKTAQNSQALAIMGAIMGGMAGAAAASGDSRPSTAFGISSAMFFAGSVGMSLSIQVYGKDRETEADSIANLYFRINKKSVNNLLNIVKRDEFTNLLEHKKPIYTHWVIQIRTGGKELKE
jgi:predicted Zn-dependent protease